MKQCSTCKELKLLDQYNKKLSNKDGLERYCKPCHKARNKQHYENNTQLYIDRALQTKKIYKEWWFNYKQQFSCVRCGEDKHWRLSFHHTDPSNKESDLATMISNSKSKQDIINEINKCIPVCHNCHADIHYEHRIGIV